MARRNERSKTCLSYVQGTAWFQVQRRGSVIIPGLAQNLSFPVDLKPQQARAMARWLNNAADDAERCKRGVKR